jgi:hypothetical protein
MTSDRGLSARRVTEPCRGPERRRHDAGGALAEIALGVGTELGAALAVVVEDLDGALETPGAEEVIDADEAAAWATRTPRCTTLVDASGAVGIE